MNKSRSISSSILRNRKAQALSVDALLSFVFFSFILILCYWMWSYSILKTNDFHAQTDVEKVSEDLYITLFTQEGYPTYWDDLNYTQIGSVKSIGLMNGPYIDTNKVAQLANLNSTSYTQLKTILGVQGVNYQFALSYYAFNVTDFLEQESYAVGRYPDQDALQVISSTYYFVNESKERAKVVVYVWR